MKRFKVLLVALVCSLLCFGLVGCYQSEEPSDVRYNFNWYGDSFLVEYYFAIDTPDEGYYDVDYRVNVYYKDELISSQNKLYIIRHKEGGAAINDTMFEYCFLDDVDVKDLSLTVTDVKVKYNSTEDEYMWYAIGFGVAGGAVLIAITVLFIFFKKKENNHAE